MTYTQKEHLKSLSAQAYNGITSRGAKLMQRYGMDYGAAVQVLEQVIKVKEAVEAKAADEKARVRAAVEKLVQEQEGVMTVTAPTSMEITE
jgi:hypothetical protein